MARIDISRISRRCRHREPRKAIQGVARNDGSLRYARDEGWMEHILPIMHASVVRPSRWTIFDGAQLDTRETLKVDHTGRLAITPSDSRRCAERRT